MKRRVAKSPRGMALMIVVCAVAIAAVMGYAMLANSSMQAQISVNTASIAQADCLAESGVNYALYCLSYPNNVTGFSSGTWQATNVSPDSSNPGTFSVAITDLGSNTFSIATTSSVSGANATAVVRKANVTAVANTVFGAANEAGGFGGTLSVPNNTTLNVIGDLQTSNSPTLSPTSTVSGSIKTSSDLQIPSSTQVTDYTSYKYKGVTYNATLLAADPAPGTTLGPTASNPGGVYYSLNRDLALKGVTINGSLLVKNPTQPTKGNLILSTSGSTITPVSGSGLPALVVYNQVKMTGANQSLTVNGLAWVNKGVGSSGAGATLNINGSLLVPVTSSQISASYNGTINLNYQADNLHVADFAPTVQTPTVKVLTWAQ